MSSAPRSRLSGFRSVRRARSRPSRGPRHLAFQPLESRRLLAIIGDWAVLDLRSQLNDATYSFKDLSGIAFHGGQLAVTANVQTAGGVTEGRLLLVDYDLDANTAQIARSEPVPSLGGSTQTLAVNSNGSLVYVTGFSNSAAAPDLGEAFRAVWDGTTIQSQPLGSIPGLQSPNPVFQSVGVGVTSTGVVTGTSDQGLAIFEYDQTMVSAGEIGVGIVYGISEDRVKVGIDTFQSFIWEADLATRRALQDLSGDGVFAFGISPDHSLIVGSGIMVGMGGTSFEKAFWWDYDTATANVVRNASGVPIDGRLTSATNSDVGYLVGRSNPTSAGDLVHITSTNQTQKIVDWFKAYSNVTIPAETSEWGPEVAYDYDSGHIAIISGGHLFTVKIWDDNLPPVAVNDAFSTPTNVPLEVAAAGVLENDTDDGNGVLAALLVTGPKYGLLDLRSDGSFTYTPKTDFNREDFFTYRATDGSYESNLATVNITIETQYPWHNGRKPLDVSDDGEIGPRDALQVINALNAGGQRPLPTEPPRTRPLSPPFYDTNPNNVLTPRDALLIINYINAGGGGEGEQAMEASADTGLGSAAPTGLLVGAVTSTPWASGGTIAAVDAALAGDAGTGSMNSIEIGWAATGAFDARTSPLDTDVKWAASDLEDLLAALCGEADDS